MPRPVIGIISNLHVINDEYEVHGGGLINTSAVAEVAGGLPLLVPATPNQVPLEARLKAGPATTSREGGDGWHSTSGNPRTSGPRQPQDAAGWHA